MNPPRLVLLLLAASGLAGCDLVVVADLGDLPPLPASPSRLMPDASFTAIDAEASYPGRMCAVRDDGRALCWGMEPQVQVPVQEITAPQPLRHITSGGTHGCGLDADGAAYCWGENWSGQLGDGSRTPRSDPVPVSGGHGFVQLAAGPYGTCGITVAQELYCWGRAGFGGDDPECVACERSDSVPVRIGGATLYRQVTLGNDHGCAVSAAGEGFCWGTGHAGQLGTGSRGWVGSPTRVDFAGALSTIAAGAGRTCALDVAGAPYCWGRTFLTEPPVAEDRTTPVAVETTLRFSSIFVGEGAACGLDAEGRAYCWGTNPAGRLGTGDDRPRDRPAPVVGDHAFATLALGLSFTCGLESGTGALFCWGERREP